MSLRKLLPASFEDHPLRSPYVLLHLFVALDINFFIYSMSHLTHERSGHSLAAAQLGKPKPPGTKLNPLSALQAYLDERLPSKRWCIVIGTSQASPKPGADTEGRKIVQDTVLFSRLSDYRRSSSHFNPPFTIW